MIPIVFGDLFGFYHPPSAPSKNGGVVLCNPFGYEAMCLHRTYRTLAEKLASAGIAALRFDVHGTGDSAGSDHDPGRLEAWTESVGFAMSELRRRAKVDDVSLFGIRFGASLAVHAANLRRDVKSLVLWSPYLTGKAFVREMRMMQTAGAEQAFAAGEDRGVSPKTLAADDTGGKGEEAIGFFLAPETVRALETIDLRKPAAPPAPRILLFGRDDLPEGDRFTKELAASGADVTDLTKLSGYAAMMQDAYLSKIPLQILDETASWLAAGMGDRAPEAKTDPTTLVDLSRQGPHLVTGNTREESVLFAKGLFGVLAEPLHDGTRTDAVIFLNIGSNHHVGSNRMYVRFARTLAEHGIPSLRFDVSGIGDSAYAGHENHPYAAQAVDDVRAAMTELEKLREIRRFYLVGLCSGAYLAFKTANIDERVIGQVLVNAQTFHWKEGDTLDVAIRRNYRSTRYYTNEIKNPETWKRILRGDVNTRGIALALGRRAVERVKHRLARAPDADLAAQLTDTLRRGTFTLMIFGANDGGLDQMESHFGRDAQKVAGERRFELRILEGSDHTLTPLWSQTWLDRTLLRTIERWRGVR